MLAACGQRSAVKMVVAAYFSWVCLRYDLSGVLTAEWSQDDWGWKGLASLRRLKLERWILSSVSLQISQLQFCLKSSSVTASLYYGRPVGWRGPLEVIWSNPLAKARPPRARTSFWVSPKDGDFTAFLGNVLQCSVAVMVRKCFLI